MNFLSKLNHRKLTASSFWMPKRYQRYINIMIRHRTSASGVKRKENNNKKKKDNLLPSLIATTTTQRPGPAARRIWFNNAVWCVRDEYVRNSIWILFCCSMFEYIRGTRRFEDPPDREAASRSGDRLRSPRLIRTPALIERRRYTLIQVVTFKVKKVQMMILF